MSHESSQNPATPVCQTLMASAPLHRKWEDALWICCDLILRTSTAGFKPLPLHPIRGVCGTGHQQELLQAPVTKQPGRQLTEEEGSSAQLPVPSKAITSQQHDKPANTATGFPEQGACHLHSALTSEKRKKSPPEVTLQPALKSSRGNPPKESGYRRHWSPLNQDLLCCNIIDVN